MLPLLFPPQTRCCPGSVALPSVVFRACRGSSRDSLAYPCCSWIKRWAVSRRLTLCAAFRGRRRSSIGTSQHSLGRATILPQIREWVQYGQSMSPCDSPASWLGRALPIASVLGAIESHQGVHQPHCPGTPGSTHSIQRIPNLLPFELNFVLLSFIEIHPRPFLWKFWAFPLYLLTGQLGCCHQWLEACSLRLLAQDWAIPLEFNVPSPDIFLISRARLRYSFHLDLCRWSRWTKVSADC